MPLYRDTNRMYRARAPVFSVTSGHFSYRVPGTVLPYLFMNMCASAEASPR